MREDNIWMNLLYLVAAIWLFRQWWCDKRAQSRGQSISSPFPGAYPTNIRMLTIAVIGALVILAIETFGEYRLGISDEQEVVHWSFLFSMLAAAIVEEIIFRGYLVYTDRGTPVLLLSIVGFSLLFALIHPYLWTYISPGEGGHSFWGELQWAGGTKAYFSTGMIFIHSLWFYAVRFLPPNAKHSLLPCFAAHLSTNVGVFAVKWMQGHVA